jgi:hypothetical protein
MAGVWSTLASAKVPYVFQNLSNALGFSDRQGFCSIWWNFDEKVDAGSGVELPIRLQFNSFQQSMADSCLGAGWWFPLLESTVVRENEKTVLANLPEGDVLRLHPSKTEQGKFHSMDHTRTGTLLEGDVFKLEGKDGWHFAYEKGRLKEARTPGGDVLHWDYDGSKVSRIISKASGTLLEARYDLATGLLEEIVFGKGKEGVRFGYTDFPLLTTVADRSMVSRLVKGLGKVESRRGFTADVAYQPMEDANSLEMVVNHATKGGAKGVDKYRWSAQNGLIQRDNFGPYVVQGGGVDAGDVVFYVENVTRAGKKMSYQYDRKKMEAVYGAADGRKFIYQYIGTPGSGFGKLRRVVDIMPDGKEIVSFVGQFDNAGNLLRSVNAAGRASKVEKINSWNPAEAVPLIFAFSTADKEDLDITGPLGRLVGAVINGTPYIYVNDESGKLRAHPEIKVPEDMAPWLDKVLTTKAPPSAIDAVPLSRLPSR